MRREIRLPVDSLPDLFVSLGGRGEVADAACVLRNTVDYWAKRGRVPAKYWDAIVTLARRKQVVGIDHTLLQELQRPIPPRAPWGSRRAAAE